MDQFPALSPGPLLPGKLEVPRQKALAPRKSLERLVSVLLYTITPYEGFNLANQKNRKLVVFDRKLAGRHSLHYVILLNIRE